MSTEKPAKLFPAEEESSITHSNSTFTVAQVVRVFQARVKRLPIKPELRWSQNDHRSSGGLFIDSERRR